MQTQENPKSGVPSTPEIEYKTSCGGITAHCPRLGIYGHGMDRSGAFQCLRMAYRAKFGTPDPWANIFIPSY